MSDFKNLTPVAQASVQVKLDGFIEACILMSRAHNIGLTEALNLTIRALLREIAAHKLDPRLAEQLWLDALQDITPPMTPSVADSIN